MNQVIPVPSYLFLYNGRNELLFLKKFSNLCVPQYDIGSNYHLDHGEAQKILAGTAFFTWDGFLKVKKILFRSFLVRDR